jgi:hypothetical protein
MPPRFLGKDDQSPQGGSPSLWDDGDSYVIQGWRITDAAALGELLDTAGQQQIPDSETPKSFCSLTALESHRWCGSRNSRTNGLHVPWISGAKRF